MFSEVVYFPVLRKSDRKICHKHQKRGKKKSELTQSNTLTNYRLGRLKPWVPLRVPANICATWSLHKAFGSVGLTKLSSQNWLCSCKRQWEFYSKSWGDTQLLLKLWHGRYLYLKISGEKMHHHYEVVLDFM